MQTSQSTYLSLEQVSLTSSSLNSRLAQGKAPTPIGLPLLKQVSFSVQQGDRVAIVGPSGAGKTSLLRLLNRLNEPASGSIYLQGQDIRQIPVRQLRQQVALVLQESKLLGMTVQEALAYPLKLQGMADSTIKQRLGVWIDRLHLPSEWLERTETQLSVGQRQLVAIVRALVSQPQILLLDEPTSALDAGRSHALLQVLQSLSQENQMTILMVNHQLDLTQQFCDRLLYLHQGQLTQDLPARAVNWVDLRQTLIQAEAEAAREWDDD